MNEKKMRRTLSKFLSPSAAQRFLNTAQTLRKTQLVSLQFKTQKIDLTALDLCLRGLDRVITDMDETVKASNLKCVKYPYI